MFRNYEIQKQYTQSNIEMEEYNSEKIIIFEPDLFNRLEKEATISLAVSFPSKQKHSLQLELQCELRNRMHS